MDSTEMLYMILMLEPLIIAFTYLLTNPIWRCKLLSRVFRGYYGIVILRGWGNNAVMLTANLKKDLLHLGDDVYALDSGFMANVKSPGDKKDLLKTSRFVGGVPLIEYDVNDAVPVEISSMKLDAKFKARLPGLIGSNIKKEISIAEAEAFDKNKELIKKLLLVVLVAVIIAAGIGAFSYMNLQNQALLLEQIYNATMKQIPAVSNGTIIGG